MYSVWRCPGRLQDSGSGSHVRAVLLLRTVGGSETVIEVLTSQWVSPAVAFLDG